MKRIIGGQSYNTETSTEVFVHESRHPSEGWLGLYQTRAGAFFKIDLLGKKHDNIDFLMENLDGKVAIEVKGISHIEARKLTEKYASHLVAQYFDAIGGGTAERRLTVRLPVNLARRVEEAALAKQVSVNTYAMRALESAVAKDGHPPTVNETVSRPGRRGKAVSKRLQERAG
jgi:hypothetical protein